MQNKIRKTCWKCKHCNEDRFCELWQKSTIKKTWCANFTPDQLCETCEHLYTCTKKDSIVDMNCDDWKLHPSLTV